MKRLPFTSFKEPASPMPIPYAGFDPEEEPLAPRANRAEACRRGHPYTESNTAIVAIRGKPFRRCRACQSENNRLQYWSNPAYRERRKANAKKYWHEVRKHRNDN